MSSDILGKCVVYWSQLAAEIYRRYTFTLLLLHMEMLYVGVEIILLAGPFYGKVHLEIA